MAPLFQPLLAASNAAVYRRSEAQSSLSRIAKVLGLSRTHVFNLSHFTTNERAAAEVFLGQNVYDVQGNILKRGSYRVSQVEGNDKECLLRTNTSVSIVRVENLIGRVEVLGYV